ncbi:ATP-binding cassette subfamily C protein PrsD [Devosia sp. UYZn731]|uniref:type I secretion system permease/ATPase n=1 Tax=Devosia sp. UYZn731 TaxID=3156345 RepID=UPI00339A5F65
MHRVPNLRLQGLAQLVQSYPVPLAAVATLSVVANLLTLTGSIFMLQVYDRVLTSRSIPTLLSLTLLTAVMYGFFIAIENLRLRIAIRFSRLVVDWLSQPLFEAYLRGGLRPNATNTDPLRDLDTVQGFIGSAGPFVLLDLPWVPIYLALIFALHPLLGWVAIAGAGTITALLIVSEMQSRGSSRRINNELLQRVALGESARSNAESVIAMGMMRQISERWLAAASRLVDSQQKTADRLAFYTSASRGFRYFLQSGVLAAGAFLAIHGDMTAGLMIAASIITARALAPVEQAIAHWRGYVSARQALRRIDDTLTAATSPAIATDLPLPHRDLVVTSMATAPAREHRPLASGISFSLQAGDGLGIVGLSGSGKSSLARAIVGVWPTLTGQIRLDGSELSHYDSERLGACTGYLPQSVELFEGTVAENITRFRSQAATSELLRAAEQSQIHDLIVSLPQGYDTQVGRHGSILSAGQRQRIGLARALYGNPFLIVLDEPNSNLDGEGDKALTGAITDAMARGAIVVVVAHRPSAIAALNKLLLMENGRQVVFGDKDEVMRVIGPQSARPEPTQLQQNGA